MRPVLRVLAIAVGGSVLLCGVAAGLSALSNRNLPSAPGQTDRLDPLDNARLAETLHLKRELGEVVWPGWGVAEIPVLIWNREYSFLVGYRDPPAPWESVPDDAFQGQPYFRRQTGDQVGKIVRLLLKRKEVMIPELNI